MNPTQIQMSNRPEFWYQFDLSKEIADYGYGNIHLGTVHFPMIRQRQVHLEYAIHTLREYERQFYIYKKKLAGRGSR
jgi:hypothetical protein